MEKTNIEVVGTNPSVPKENPQKRLDLDWQLREILDSTLPKKPIEIPKEGGKKFAFGTLTDGQKIDSKYLFGSLEINNMNGENHEGDKQIMLSLNLYTEPTKGNELTDIFRQEFISLHDIYSNTQVEFNNPFDGGEKYIPNFGEVDLSFQNPQLNGIVNHGENPIYDRFTLSRVYTLSDKTEGEKIDGKSVFVFGLNEALPKK